MNFKGHLSGGLITASAVTTVALISSVVPLQSLQLESFQLEAGFGKLLLIFAVTLFMALFPDLDTASIAQRWFYRIALIVVIWLYLEGQFLILYLFTLTSFLPLLHQHRGWTHWLATPWVLSVLMAFYYEFHQAETSWFHSFDLDDLQEVWLEHQFFVFAAVLGHYTHLFLDSKRVRLLGLHPSRKGHH